MIGPTLQELPPTVSPDTVALVRMEALKLALKYGGADTRTTADAFTAYALGDKAALNDLAKRQEANRAPAAL